MTIPNPPYAVRIALARQLQRLKESTAEKVTREFLLVHPDWVERYGNVAFERGCEDAVYHVEFLISALEAGSVAAYGDYAGWTRRVLESRGIASTFLAENLQQIETALSGSLGVFDQQVVHEYIAAAVNACHSQELSSEHALHGYAAVYTQSILAGNRQTALNVALEAVRSGLSVPAVYTDIVQPAMYEVGRQWESNEITVAREHMATAVSQFVVGQLYALAPRSMQERGRLIVTGVEGELHQLGAMMVADVLEFDGWAVRFLGTNMPHAGILEAVGEQEAAVIGISATMLFNLPSVARLVEELKGRYPQIRVIVGGAAFRSSPNFSAEIGADAFAPDLATAIEKVRAL